MKILYWLVGIWAFVAVVSGIVGDVWLQQRWRDNVQASFEVSARVSCERILRIKDLNEPPEDNEDWKTIESELDLSLVPESNVSPLSLGSVSWKRSATGGPRLSMRLDPRGVNENMPLAPESPIYGKTIRITREFRGRPLWWSLWGGTNLCGFCFAIAVFRFLQRRTQVEQTLLGPWVSATEAVSEVRTGQHFMLPLIRESDSNLEHSLGLVAERVNDIVAKLQSANERSDLVLGNLQEGVLAVDDRSRVLLANNAIKRQLELYEELYLYRPLLEVVRIPAVTKLMQAVQKEQVQREETIEFGSANLSLRLLARPIPLGENRLGALLTVRDETILKRIEILRRDFVANASHELKTPLAAIRAYAETLQMGALDDRDAAEQFVSNIIGQADRINGLVQGMLQLSRVQAGTAIRIEAFETAEALKPCIAAAEVVARNKGVGVSVSNAKGLTLRSDRDGFQTIASNLLSNAVRYTPSGGKVTVTTSVDGDWFVLVVQDTGVGIHKEDLERIWERFYRAEKDRSVDTGGTGLGLSIVKHLVHALGGQVFASSQPQAGSRFEVRLPIVSQ
jgi:two-component system, OmpR family, phosphate regulon sensor histidine kinase PhoR